MQPPASQSPRATAELERRCRELSAIAELSQRAIMAADADALLPYAHELTRSILGIEVDLVAAIDDARIGDAVADRLDANALDFLRAVVNVLRRVSTRRDRELIALASVEARFSRMFQHSPVALGMSTIADGRIIDVNERWLSIFGYQRDEVIGRTNAELRLDVEGSRRSEFAERAIAGGVIRNAEIKARSKSGEILDLMVSAVPLETSIEERVWMSACVDVTDRRRAEAERDQLLAREQIARSEAEQAIEKLRAVYTMTDGMPPQSPLGELLVDVLRRLRRTLQIDHATVFVLDEEGKMLHLRAIEPQQDPQVPAVRVPLGAAATGRVAAEGRPLIVNDYSTVDSSAILSADHASPRQTKAVMGAPFRIGDRVAGVVMVSSQVPRQFTDEDLRLLVLAADRVGPAIERGRLIDRIRTGMQRQRTLSRRLLTAQEEERRRVAVELHDELGQILTAVKINLESLQRAPDSEATPPKLLSMIESVDDALQRVKDIALDLRPSVLDDLGLEAALRWFTDRMARHAGVAAHLSIDTLPALEPGLQTACFRVTQEALTNVDRHARAHQVWIDLHVLDGALELTVRDDGVGFDVAAAKARAISGESVGLLGMQERVSLLGGDYDILRMPSGGTQVRARFPLSTGSPE